MAWKIKFTLQAEKQLEKLGKQKEKEIRAFFQRKILALKDPKVRAKPLRYNKKGLWRYRVDDVRVICEFFDDELLILVLEVGHRSEIYL